MDYFDLHCDTLTEAYQKRANLYRNTLAVSLEQAGVFARYIQVFALWIPDGVKAPQNYFARRMRFAAQQLTANADRLRLVDSAGALGAPTVLGGLLSIENAAPVLEDADDTDKLYASGVRTLSLTWNAGNRLASGCHVVGGLTTLGREVVKRMNQLHMALDLSHLNDVSFEQAAACGKYLMASHSNARSVTPHVRNLTDAQIKTIRDRRGIIGLCFYPLFLGDGMVFERFYLHLLHFLRLGCEDAVAIGSDFDGAIMDRRLYRLSMTPALYAYLKQKSLPKSLLDKLFFENAFRYYRNLLTNAP